MTRCARALGFALITAATALVACGNSNGGSNFDGGPPPDVTKGNHDSQSLLKNPLEAGQAFNVTPTQTTVLSVKAGANSPTATFKATLNGTPVAATWKVDQGDIGTIGAGPSSSAVFTPTGIIGGPVTLTAGAAGQVVTRQIQVNITATQNGPATSDAGASAESAQMPTMVSQLSAGGGVGGVGGEGLGVAASMAAVTTLNSPPSDGGSQPVTLLYPYNNTVWPRGMLAPLIMWTWAPGDADAIKMELSTGSGSYSWVGYFGPPMILTQTGGKFIRMPIPQDVWSQATTTAGVTLPSGKTDGLVFKLTVEKAGVVSGPVTETWPVAPARLTGTVYYNSYGTNLVKNWGTTDQAGNPVGAAILGIQSGQTGPTLVAGQNSPLGGNGIPTDDSGCRVCHVVSSHGGWLLTQSEQGSPGDGQSYLYNLSAANVQGSAVAIPTQGTFAWAAMVGDGTYALTNAIDPSSSNPAITNSSAGGGLSSFWQFAPTPGAAALPLNGLPAGVAAGYPSYAPDDKLIAYVDVTGHTQFFGDFDAGTTPTNDLLKVASYDAATQTFSNVLTIASPEPGTRIGYPVFLPDDSGLLFETEVRAGGDNVMVTRNGARSELWWVALGANPKPVRLDTLNGKAPSGMPYIPIGGNNHGIAGGTDPQDPYSEQGWDDTTLNYEPTVLPVVAGGYAWVVFTSRRLYGSQLTEVPYLSWPPDYNITKLATATVKKLWVAAIDLNSPASSDISHPAFYLPAQEILAGNSRGFFVLDPCKANGASCLTGDQCCNGYCETGGDAGSLVCSSASGNACSAVQEKCTTNANCCDTTNSCVDGFCAVQSAK